MLVNASLSPTLNESTLVRFRGHYERDVITKEDIFYYIYALLHHPVYRERFAKDLQRELPRIPFAPDFTAFATAAKELTDLHIGYKSLEPWPLK